ncbi:hypothetical protein [Salipiger sp. IMCC34102]|uniref:hypothetical protein n=1 Tax=Salipiger sp. IMCC34102 TaxID=2510647 RepID=UPI0013EB070A|nr:hypothetical protein [Salipiger sp. IMCC34102]
MTKDNDHDGEDRRPTIAQDDKKPREDVKESLSNTTDTMDEGPAGSPDADKQSRTN